VDITAQLTALMLRLKMIVTWLFDAISTSVEQNDRFSSEVAFERALSAFIVCPIHIGTVFAVVFFCSRTIKKVIYFYNIWCQELFNYLLIADRANNDRAAQTTESAGRQRGQGGGKAIKLMACIHVVNIPSQLQIFAMQLLQNRSQFTAAEVFPLDFTLLYSVKF
jgi:hypothetical protein